MGLEYFILGIACLSGLISYPLPIDRSPPYIPVRIKDTSTSGTRRSRWRYRRWRRLRRLWRRFRGTSKYSPYCISETREEPLTRHYGLASG